MKIKINCTGTENISIDKFTELQGNLKELSKENYEKLKNSILKYGFSFPIFCFKLKNIHYIADAHQRVKTLKELRKEGYEVPELPTVFITAKDKKQAKELLLQLNSNYGKTTNEGLYEFLNEPEFEIDFDFLKDIDLPEFDLVGFEQGYVKDEIKAEEIRPFKKTHFLISFNSDKLIDIQKYLDEISKIEGIEIEQGSN